MLLPRKTYVYKNINGYEKIFATVDYLYNVQFCFGRSKPLPYNCNRKFLQKQRGNVLKSDTYRLSFDVIFMASVGRDVPDAPKWY